MRLKMAMGLMRMLGGYVGKLPAGHLWYLLRQLRHEKPHLFEGQIRVNSFFPPWPSRAYDRFNAALVARKRVPYSTYLSVSQACPFRCAHCSARGRGGGVLSEVEQVDVVGQIRELGGATLGLTGGEPLLCGHVERLVEAASPEVATVLFTTGWGLTAARATALKRAGLTNITIGIEHAEAEAHDAVRGVKGSFEAAVRAIEFSREAGLYVAISTMATRGKLAGGDLQRIYELGRRWGVQEWRVLTPAATGGWMGEPGVRMSDAEVDELRGLHRGWNREADGPAVASFARLESDELFGCGAGYHHLYIDAAGEVCPCDLTPVSMGSVKREPLRVIWERMGEAFGEPRCGCLMGALEQRLVELTVHGEKGADLPVEVDDLPGGIPAHDGRLPELYRRLLRRKRVGGHPEGTKPRMATSSVAARPTRT